MGIVGAGEIVVGMHLPTLMASDGVRVRWVVDANGTRARDVGRAFGIAGDAAPSDATNLPAADVVLLAIPYGARDPYYSALSARGCAVYVEKPFARTIAYHHTIARQFPPHKLGIGLQRRAWAPITSLRTVVAQRLFGRLTRIDLGFGGPGIVTGGNYMSDLSLTGGGILFENGVHWLDAAVFVAGATASRARSGRMIQSRGFDLDTQACVELTTQDGDHIDLDLKVSVLADTLGRMDFHFDSATVSCSFSSPLLTVRSHAGSGTYSLRATQAAPETAYQTLHAHWRQFLEGVRTGRVGDVSAVSTEVTTELIEHLYALASQVKTPA